MAFATREVIIANPGRKPMAKLRGAKKAAFLRRMARGRKKAARKSNPARHRARTKPQKARKAKKAAPRKKSSHRPRSNPGEVITLLAGNPGRRKSVAKAHRTKKKKRASHNPARRPHKVAHRRKHRNPAGLPAMSDILMLGVGGVVGGVGATTGAQLLGSSNTGWVGYAANLLSTGVIAWLVHMFSKNKMLSYGIWAGGVGATIKRVMGDYSLLGSVGTSLGVGDYMASNFVTAQRLPDALHSAMVQIPQGWGSGGPVTVGAGQAASAYALGIDDARGFVT